MRNLSKAMKFVLWEMSRGLTALQEMYKKATQAEPRHANAFKNLSVLYAKVKKLPELAITTLQESLRVRHVISRY